MGRRMWSRTRLSPLRGAGDWDVGRPSGVHSEGREEGSGQEGWRLARQGVRGRAHDGHDLLLRKPAQVSHRKLQRSVDQAANRETVNIRVHVGDRAVVAGEEQILGRQEASPQPYQGCFGVEGLPLVDDHGRVLVGLLHSLPSVAGQPRPGPRRRPRSSRALHGRAKPGQKDHAPALSALFQEFEYSLHELLPLIRLEDRLGVGVAWEDESLVAASRGFLRHTAYLRRKSFVLTGHE